jgi:hypothetical protein
MRLDVTQDELTARIRTSQLSLEHRVAAGVSIDTIEETHTRVKQGAEHQDHESG